MRQHVDGLHVFSDMSGDITHAVVADSDELGTAEQFTFAVAHVLCVVVAQHVPGVHVLRASLADITHCVLPESEVPGVEEQFTFAVAHVLCLEKYLNVRNLVSFYFCEEGRVYLCVWRDTSAQGTEK